MKTGKQIIIGIGVLIVAALLVGQAGFAHPGLGPGRMEMMRRMEPSLLEQLQLSGDQRAQIESIFASGRDAIRPLAQQLREKHQALRETTRVQPLDETVVRSWAQEIADLQAQLMVTRAQMMNQLLSLLTEDQRTKLSQLRAERLQQFKEWRRQHMGRPEPQQS